MYTVTLKKPKNITLHYNSHDITVDDLDTKNYILNNVPLDEMDELFRSGIVLSVVKNEPIKKEK